MDTIAPATLNMSGWNLAFHVAVILVASIISIVSFALLLPLDSVAAVTGVSIIMGVAYGIALLIWLCVIVYYTQTKADASNLLWLNTNLMFLVVLPATIGATAMNVTAIQNTRNLLAGQTAP